MCLIIRCVIPDSHRKWRYTAYSYIPEINKNNGSRVSLRPRRKEMGGKRWEGRDETIEMGAAPSGYSSGC